MSLKRGVRLRSNDIVCTARIGFHTIHRPVCEPGSYVSTRGSALTPAACTSCPEGTHQGKRNQDTCLPCTDCTGILATQLDMCTRLQDTLCEVLKVRCAKDKVSEPSLIAIASGTSCKITQDLSGRNVPQEYSEKRGTPGDVPEPVNHT